MSVGDQSKPVFGRRDHLADVKPPPKRTAPPPLRLHPAIVTSAVLVVLVLAVAGITVLGLTGVQGLHAEAGQAERQAAAIVNQPVTHLPRTRAAE